MPMHKLLALTGLWIFFKSVCDLGREKGMRGIGGIGREGLGRDD